MATVEACRGCQAMRAREEALTDKQRTAGNHTVLMRNSEVNRGESA